MKRDQITGRMVVENVYERFFRFIEFRNGCWLWTGFIAPNGYGDFWYEGHSCHAHTSSYRLFRGEIPAGRQIDHLCKVRRCVKPDHMEVVTPRENLMRAETNAAINVAKTQCIWGHPLSGENLYLHKDKDDHMHRRCKVCYARRDRERKQRKKQING